MAQVTYTYLTNKLCHSPLLQTECINVSLSIYSVPGQKWTGASVATRGECRVSSVEFTLRTDEGDSEKRLPWTTVSTGNQFKLLQFSDCTRLQLLLYLLLQFKLRVGK